MPHLSFAVSIHVNLQIFNNKPILLHLRHTLPRKKNARKWLKNRILVFVGELERVNRGGAFFRYKYFKQRIITKGLLFKGKALLGGIN